jgi:uncharacterized protein (TIGR00304 family)
MNKYFILAILFFIIGGIIIAMGIAQGAETASWAIIIPPIFIGSGWPFSIGSLFIFIGFILMYIGFFSRAFTIIEDDEFEYEPPVRRPVKTTSGKSKSSKPGSRAPNQRTDAKAYKQPVGDNYYQPRPRTTFKTGGVVFIGPIPILWGSDKKIATIMAVVSVILVVIFLIFTVSWIYI